MTNVATPSDYILLYAAVQVYTGELKFSVELNGWTFAGNGQFVDVDVIVKVPPGRAMNRKVSQGKGRPVGFALGADATATFSTKVGGLA